MRKIPRLAALGIMAALTVAL
ncbi:MAG: hypothetical protein QOI36_6127, partial [Pseudonocardiales bacterium]|nr:hypothetical protein [Pseudonocardiales bacterium]